MSKYLWKIACAGMALTAVLTAACRDDDFNVGAHLIDSYTTAGMLDTVTVRVSNLMVSDSVVTSGKSIGFVGAYNDLQTGRIQAQSYIEFHRTVDSETDRNARFDSAMLVLRPNGNYFGDTLQYVSFSVSRIAGQIEKRQDGNMYSTSHVPLGTTYVERPPHRIRVKDITNNELEVKLDDALGKELFEGIVRDDDNYKTDKFLRTFSGLAVGAGESSNCVYGLNLQDSACMIRIYYHISKISKEEKMMTFKANAVNSFYRMGNDLKNQEHLAGTFSAKSAPVPSLLTGNKGIVMSGSMPMYVRLEFPHLNELLWLGQIVKIKKATLYVRPVHRSFDTVPLPPRLSIYEFDPQSNTPLTTALSTPSEGGTGGSVMYGNLPEDYRLLQMPHFPQYTFDVTAFIAGQLGASGNRKKALSLLVPDDVRESSLQRLVLGDQQFVCGNEFQSRNNQVKLEIIYTVYND